MKRATKNRIITIFILLMFVGSSITYAIISAVPVGTTSSNWGARLAILINDDLYPIPEGIGILANNTTEKIYTPSTDGTLFKSIAGDVTLKDFFEEWNQTFNSTCILSYCNTNTSYVTMFVNNKINLEYENYVIQNNDIIIIEYR